MALSDLEVARRHVQARRGTITISQTRIPQDSAALDLHGDDTKGNHASLFGHLSCGTPLTGSDLHMGRKPHMY